MSRALFYSQLNKGQCSAGDFSRGWCPLNAESISRVQPQWHEWLSHPGSLTSKLMRFSGGDFRVRVLSETWQRPSYYEAFKLDLNPALAVRVREVELFCNDRAMVYARTIIPLELHQRESALFRGMGSRPLGHFLFREGKIEISRRDIKTHCLADKGSIHARATPFGFRNSEILVCEYFVDTALIGN